MGKSVNFGVLLTPFAGLQNHPNMLNTNSKGNPFRLIGLGIG